MIFLSPSQEKNLYGLGFDEDDLTEMNPEKMELAYGAQGKKTAIAASSAGELWGGYTVPEPVVAEANDKEEDRGKQANLWMGEPPPAPLPDPTAGQLMCHSHGKLCNKGICRDLCGRRGRKGRLRGGEVVVGEAGSVQLLAFWFTDRVWPLVSSALCGSVKLRYMLEYTLSAQLGPGAV